MGVKCIYHNADMAKPDEITAMIEVAVEAFGSVDILVNNAGVYGASEWFNYDIPREEDWEATIEEEDKEATS